MSIVTRTYYRAVAVHEESKEKESLATFFPVSMDTRRAGEKSLVDATRKSARLSDAAFCPKLSRFKLFCLEDDNIYLANFRYATLREKCMIFRL